MLAIAVVLLLVLAAVQGRRMRRLGRRLDRLTRGGDDTDLAGVLDAHLDKVSSLARDVDELTVRTAMVETSLRRSFQRVGMVRFNPFDDTGGNQSFALALLDSNGDGVIVSSLHSRTGTRVYAKAVTGGRAETALSEEEARAVGDALAGGSARASGAA